VTKSGSDATELQLIKEERMSTQKCLEICAQLSNHIDEIQPIPKSSDSPSGHMDPSAVPEKLTMEGLQECKKSLMLTAARLESHLKARINRLVTKLKGSTAPEDDLADISRLQEEWDTARQCIDICSKADSNLKESISSFENYATGDAIQFMVSTNNKTIHGTNRGLGWRTRQVGGHLSDDTVQQLSRDFFTSGIQSTESERRPLRGNTPPVRDDGLENKSGSEFKELYGRGFKLTPKTTADTPVSSTMPADGNLNNSSKG
jgi:hypothetical protein